MTVRAPLGRWRGVSTVNLLAMAVLHGRAGLVTVGFCGCWPVQAHFATDGTFTSTVPPPPAPLRLRCPRSRYDAFEWKTPIFSSRAVPKPPNAPQQWLVESLSCAPVGFVGDFPYRKGSEAA
jgi:hypothetical protein